MAKSSFESELIASTELAKAALLEVTDASTVGDCIGHEVIEDGVGNLFFACTLRGYPGWRWTATLAKVSPTDPVTVLEVELLPADGALLPPDWVPWSVRLAQYQESQALLEAELAAAALVDDEDADDELDDDELDDDDLEDDILENDFSDFDDEIDGVDIDALADDEDSEDDATDEDELEDDVVEQDVDAQDEDALATQDDR